MAGFHVRKLAGDRWQVKHRRLYAYVALRSGECLVWIDGVQESVEHLPPEVEPAISRARALLQERYRAAEAAERLGAFW